MKQIFSMNDDWKFRVGDDASASTYGGDFDMFSGYTKTGALTGPGSDGYCDADWETVQLPHDALPALPFVAHGGAQGSKPRTAVWYRKSFFAPVEWDGKRIFLRFDGIACRAAILLNNICIARSDSTYTPVTVEITDLLYYGQPNLLAVRADNAKSEGWWYDGCGIYRDVTLTVADKSHFVPDGVFVSAVPASDRDWTLTVRAEMESPRARQTLRVRCLDAEASVPASSCAEVHLTVANPPLWSLDTPNRTTVSAVLCDESGEPLDETVVSFGFRTVRFDPDCGCLVNGVPVKLKGVCLHADHAGVGTAIPYELHLYRLRRLRDMGCNAIRTSHNPQSPGFYQACDELGFAVMDETRHFGAAPAELHQLRTMIRRDRNHPCVFLWSLFNEEPLQCTAMGEKIARTMKRIVDEEDGTRPVTGGMNGPLECAGAVRVVDVMGFNYLQYGYDRFHQLFPHIGIIGLETESYLTQRGETKNYDDGTVLRRSAFARDRATAVQKQPANLCKWSDTPGDTWRRIAARPFVAGEFAWTGFDYRGEAHWPGVIADFGAMDLCGFPKESFYWHRALWHVDDTLYAVRTDEQLRCYTNGDRVRVTSADGAVQEWANDPCDPQSHPVPDGTLTVDAFLGTRKIGTQTVAVPKAPARLELTCSGACAYESGATVFHAVLRDDCGTVCDSDRTVHFAVTNGILLGVGNGDSSSHEPDCADTRRLFHGCAQAVVRAGRSDTLTVTAICDEWTAVCTVPVKPSDVPSIPSCVPWIRICPWRMSDVSDVPPTPDQLHDLMYNWIPTTVGVSENLMMSGAHGYASLAGSFDAPTVPAVIHLTQLAGRFDLYMCGQKVLSSADEALHSYELPVPAPLRGQRVQLSLVFTCTGEMVCVGDIYLTAE